MKSLPILFSMICFGCDHTGVHASGNRPTPEVTHATERPAQMASTASAANADEEDLTAEEDMIAEEETAIGEDTAAEEEAAAEEETVAGPQVSVQRPYRGWWNTRTCETSISRVLPLEGLSNEEWRLAAIPDGALVVWRTDSRTLRYQGLAPDGTVTEVNGQITAPSRARFDAIHLQRTETGYLMAVAGRCGRERCFHGYAFDSDAQLIAEQAQINWRHAHINEFDLVPLHSRFSQSLWLTRLRSHGSRSSFFETFQLSWTGDTISFERGSFGISISDERRNHFGGETANVLRHLPFVEDDHYNAIVGWEASDLEGRPVRGRSLHLHGRSGELRSMGNRIIDFFTEGEQGHLLVRRDEEVEYVVVSIASNGTVAMESRAVVDTNGPLPGPFRTRIRPTLEGTALVMKDPLDRTVGATIEVDESTRLDFTGLGFLLSRLRGDELHFSLLHCVPSNAP